MELFNSVVTRIFDAIFFPLNFLGTSSSIVIISILAGIALLFVYGKVSNQKAIKKVKKGIAAGIYESVLFRNDLKVSLKAQGKMFLGGMKYFALAIPPIIILSIPCLIILAQLNLRFGVKPLSQGESTILTIGVKDDSSLFSAELVTPEGILSTPPLRDLDNHQVSWRLDAKTPHSGNITLKIADKAATQKIFVGENQTKIPTETHTSSWLQFFYPGSTIPSELKSLVTEIVIKYPEQEISIFGLNTNWLITFLVVSILAGIVGSKFLKVEI